ncbi:MAG: TetR/AcrR family transcriptional regulator [Pseudomonadota bacterium]
MQPATKSPAIDGHQKRRLATRARLINAARSVMAKRSVDALTIEEIIQQAQVGKGSFYNHFASKEELFFATMDECIAEIAQEIITIKGKIEDPAEFIAAGIRIYVDRATDDAELARFIVTATASTAILARYSEAVIRQTIEEGVRAKRFTLRNPELFFTLVTTGATATIAGQLEGKFGQTIGSELAASVLQLAGLDSDEATAIANLPIPNPD